MGGAFLYPTMAIPYTSVSHGSASAIKPGMTLTLGTAALGDDLGRQRVQDVATGSTIPVARSSEGTRDGELAVSDGIYITVYDDYRVWAKLPYIDNSVGLQVMYKDGNIPSSSINSHRSVANGGPGYMATIDPTTGVITHTFDGSASFEFDGDGTSYRDVASYAWDKKDGTVIAGAVDTDTVTCTFPPGFRWVDLKVESHDGKFHTCHIPVFARDPAHDKCLPHQITGYKFGQDGQEVSLRFLCALPRTLYPDGTLLMLFSEDDPNPVIRFTGWHQTDENSENSERTGTSRYSTLAFVDVAGRLKRLPGLAQIVRSTSMTVQLNYSPSPGDTTMQTLILERVIPSGTSLVFHPSVTTVTLTSTAALGDDHINVSAIPSGMSFGDKAIYTKSAPDRWDETDIPNFVYYAWYILHWHSTALDLADFLPSIFFPATLIQRQFHELGSDEGNLFDQADKILSAVDPDHHLTCNRDGQLFMQIDPNLLVESDRPVSSVALFTSSDWSEISFTDERPPRIFRLTAYGIICDPYEDVAVKCIAPKTEGQGSSSVELTNRYTDNAFTMYYVEGNRYAKMNARHGTVTMTMPIERIGNHLDPARMEFVQIEVDNQPRDFFTYNNRGLVTEVNLEFSYDEKGSTCVAHISWIEETVGPYAVGVTPNGVFI